MANRAVGKARVIPVKAFEHEQQYLTKVPPYVRVVSVSMREVLVAREIS
jgi:hypothetical protein